MQGFIVSLIVAAAAGYTAWRLMPKNMRRWLIGRMLVVAPSRRAWLARLEVGAENDACSSCRGCAVGENLPVAPGQSKIEVYGRKREKVTTP